jgi:TM2 domain-containing membrane protein YozV
MHCRNCGREVAEKAPACPGCGFPPLLERKFCQGCGSPTDPRQVLCVRCGTALAASTGTKSKVLAGLLGIFLGGLGIHKFYLGYGKAGAIMLAASLLGGLVSHGAISAAVGAVGLVEGIIYLTRSEADFERTYVAGRREWF